LQAGHPREAADAFAPHGDVCDAHTRDGCAAYNGDFTDHINSYSFHF